VNVWQLMTHTRLEFSMTWVAGVARALDWRYLVLDRRRVVLLVSDLAR
jgi:hypothetical protein